MKSGMIQGCPLSALIFNKGFRQEKEMKEIQYGKKNKILYLKHSRGIPTPEKPR
jgi:hypothetical protein